MCGAEVASPLLCPSLYQLGLPILVSGMEHVMMPSVDALVSFNSNKLLLLKVASKLFVLASMSCCCCCLGNSNPCTGQFGFVYIVSALPDGLFALSIVVDESTDSIILGSDLFSLFKQ